jgi:hypothetical protein
MKQKAARKEVLFQSSRHFWRFFSPTSSASVSLAAAYIKKTSPTHVRLEQQMPCIHNLFSVYKIFANVPYLPRRYSYYLYKKAKPTKSIYGGRFNLWLLSTRAPGINFSSAKIVQNKSSARRQFSTHPLENVWAVRNKQKALSTHAIGRARTGHNVRKFEYFYKGTYSFRNTALCPRAQLDSREIETRGRSVIII